MPGAFHVPAPVAQPIPKPGTVRRVVLTGFVSAGETTEHLTIPTGNLTPTEVAQRNAGALRTGLQELSE